MISSEYERWKAEFAFWSDKRHHLLSEHGASAVTYSPGEPLRFPDPPPPGEYGYLQVAGPMKIGMTEENQ